MIMNDTYLITIFVFFNFILLKKLNNHIKYIIKNYFFSYILYFEFFKMIINYYYYFFRHQTTDLY